jgi:hypothetical protein
MEITYDYKTFNYVKDHISPNFLKPLTFPIPFISQESNPDHYMSDDGYLHTTFLNNNVEYGAGPKFQYRINSNGFRSDHFEKLDNSNINILVAGCSFTFGEGLPEEYTWPRLLEKKIKDKTKKNIKTYNIGYMGNSILNILSLIKSFINEHGKPDFIFMCLPDLTRDVAFCQVEGRYKNLITLKAYIEDKKKFKTEFKYMDNFVYETNIYQTMNELHMFEMLCDFAGIKLIWTNWWKPDTDIYKFSQFKNFVEMDQSVYTMIDEHLPNAYEEIRKADLENVNSWPYWKKARDENHPGSRWTNILSDLFLTEMDARYGNVI